MQFHYDQRVRIVKGFYTGMNGIIRGYGYSGFFKWKKLYYLVDFPGFCLRLRVPPTGLELVYETTS